ncbi:MAG: hypothetical protein WBZ48_02090 [Bacteroidota bacterium]
MKRHFFSTVLFSVTLLLFGSCTKQFTNEPKPNVPPTTRLWLAPDSVLLETVSRQHLYWYGEDPDGMVKGYLLAVGNFKPPPTKIPSPDTMTYTWVTITDTLIALPLRAIRDSFIVVVRSVDNTFEQSPLLPEGAIVRMTPKPYWDKDTNGIYDAGDVSLSNIEAAADPKGAILLFPIRNTPPTVQFAANPVDSSTIQQPETTYTVATFSWVGHDADGDNTIVSYRIALNDTSSPTSWVTLSSKASLVTIAVPRSVSDGAPDNGIVTASVYTGVFPGLQYQGTISGLKLNAQNVLYVQDKDVAGEYSKAARMPSSPTGYWYVKKPKGKMLVVKDYIQSDSTTALQVYHRVFSDPSIAGGTYGNFDIFDVGYGLSLANSKPNQTADSTYGNFVPPNINPAFILTLQLYNLVYWFSDLYPSYTPARIGLFNFTQRGGKVIFSTTFPENISFPDISALNDFAPIDSVTTDPNSSSTVPTNADNRVPYGTSLAPFDSTSGYPLLTFGPRPAGGGQFVTPSPSWRRIYKRIDAQYIYQMDSVYTDSTVSPPQVKRGRFLGSPPIAVIDNAKTFVLVAVPVHLLNGNTTALTAFFRKVIVDQFGLQ